MCVDLGTMNTIVAYSEDLSPDSIIDVSKCTASDDKSCATRSVMYLNSFTEVDGTPDLDLTLEPQGTVRVRICT